ncbi:hypothetical protein FRC11_008173, partial [Ceratobasidium sp. 423]
GDGLITAEELDAVLYSLGLNTTEGELQDIIRGVHADSSGTVGLSGGSLILARKMVDVDLQKIKEREVVDNDEGESDGNAECRDLVANIDKNKAFESKLPNSREAPSALMDGFTDTPRPAFLETGDAANVWRLDNIQEEGKPETSRVFKVIRVYPQNFNKTSAGYKISWDDFVRDLQARVATWAQFDHPNLVRVYPARDLSLSSEFCSHGSVRDYLKTLAGQRADKVELVELIHDILMGVEYLHGHSPPIVHASLSAGKIFVDMHGKAKIGEFGLVDFCSQVSLLTTAIIFEGFVRCTSPEVFNINPDGSVTRTTQSDVWALGCILFEIISGELPYSQYRANGAILRAITAGELPGSRNVDFDGIHGGEFWSLMVEPCWSWDPAERPSVAELVLRHSSLKAFRGSESCASSVETLQTRAISSTNSGSSGSASHATVATSLGSSPIQPPPPLDSTPENE